MGSMTFVRAAGLPGKVAAPVSRPCPVGSSTLLPSFSNTKPVLGQADAGSLVPSAMESTVVGKVPCIRSISRHT